MKCNILVHDLLLGFVMSSPVLGFVVIESLASGVPVVGARAGGIPSIIEDGKTGLLSPPGNVTEFTNKVSDRFFFFEM